MTTAILNADAEVSRVVRILLAANDRRQSELAAHLGVDPATITRLMKGRRHWTLDELRQTADFLGTDIHTLLSEEVVVRSRCFPEGDDSPANQMVLPLDDDGLAYVPDDW